MVTFAEGMLEFHQQCTEILKVLVETLQEKCVRRESETLKQDLMQIFVLNRKEEAESRPKLEFIPKTLQDLTLEQICESTEALNGGRFAKPSSDFNRARNSKNSLYSSQQNLSHNNNNNNSHAGSRPGSTGSNFSRSKFYGSQQNLQTSTKMSLSSVGSASSMDQNRNPANGYEANAIDPWLNAWDSPASANPPPPTAATRHTNSNNRYTSTANATAFRMPGPPGGGGGPRNGQSNNNNNNNNHSHFVHSNGNEYGSSSKGNGRQFSNNLSSSPAQAHNNRNLNTLNNNNNYSDPWSGDSLFYFLLILCFIPSQ